MFAFKPLHLLRIQLVNNTALLTFNMTPFVCYEMLANELCSCQIGLSERVENTVRC